VDDAPGGVRALPGEDVGGVPVGVAHVDDERETDAPRECDRPRERRALGVAGRVLVVVVEPVSPMATTPGARAMPVSAASAASSTLLALCG
jgi:hypothetical protein